MTVFYLGTAALIATILAAVAFPILYLRSPWRDSPLGRDTMLFASAMVAVLLVALSTALLGFSDPVRVWIRLGIYLTTAVVFWRRVLLLYRIQREPLVFTIRDPKKQRPHPWLFAKLSRRRKTPPKEGT